MIEWRHWHNEPWLIGGLVVLGWLWAVAAGPWRGRLAPEVKFPRGKAVWFYLGLLCFYLAVGSPLDQVAERYLFSAHMLQHQLLVYPAAICFLLGLPPWMIDPLLAPRAVQVPLRWLTHPIVCGGLFAVIVGAWHAPLLYDWALRSKPVHVLEHLMFFAAALLFWWPVLSPSRVLPRRGYATQMLYQLGVLIAMTPLFAYITFAQDILYPTYEFAPRLFANFSAAEDQLLAGVMMKMMGVFGGLTAFGVAFFGWYQKNR